MSADLTPYAEHLEPGALDDLRMRIRATRWPSAPADAGWSLGTDVGYLRKLAAYWADDFDWPAQSAALSKLPRFRAEVGGLDIHLVHARAAAFTRPLPLVLCHGWPDSFWRYSKVIDLLTDPAAHGGDAADAFDVVVPDMPGYGYSQAPSGAALASKGVAGLWAILMADLGYERYAVAGGDIGSGVARYLALDDSPHVAAVHRMDAGQPMISDPPADATPDELRWIEGVSRWNADEGAYGHLHRTKPQTAAFGLTDSPVGLLAWIVEKLRAWSDCDGDVENRFTRDEILTNVTIYWLTGSIASSMRMYNANAALPASEQERHVDVPSGFSVFPGDISAPPESWVARSNNVVSYREMPHGGHFAPFEEPELYVRELRDFFRPFRAA